MSTTSDFSNINPSKFELRFGFYADPDVMWIPYTSTEQKILAIMRNDTSELSKHEKNQVKYYHYYLPQIIGAFFGLSGVLMLWTLEKNIQKSQNAKNEQNAGEDPTRNKDKKIYDSDREILLKTAISKRSQNFGGISEKLDYLKATQKLGENPGGQTVISKLKGGKLKYFIFFSLFYTIGSIQGVCRSRIHLYHFSKERENQLEKYDPSQAFQTAGDSQNNSD